MTMATQGMIGADIGRLRGLASEFTAAADRIDAELRAVTTSVRNTPWQGTNADRFRQSWNSVHSTRLRALANQLRDAARILRTNADDQQHVSNAGAGGHGGGLAGRIARGLVPVGGIGLTLDWNKIVGDLDSLKDLKDLASLGDIGQLLRAFAKMNELPLLQIRGLPVLDLVLDGVMAAYWISAEGISDARSGSPWETWPDVGCHGCCRRDVRPRPQLLRRPRRSGWGTLDRHGDRPAVGLLPGNEKLTDRWADAALGSEDFERRLDGHRDPEGHVCARRSSDGLTRRAVSPWKRGRRRRRRRRPGACPAN